jgi:EAL domain-containing protein (putative c-di-GMP-specific phosphodiesterase class I)
MFMHEGKDSVSFLNESYFVPHFQPIVNVVNRNIHAYEVLGRYKPPESNTIQSLGAFFHSHSEDTTSLYNLDRVIREKAIKHLKESNAHTKLFLNMMPNFLSKVHKDQIEATRFHIIQLIERYDIDHKSIVLEITEDEFEGSNDKLIKMVNLFRDYGLKIALDDMGVGFSNLERIGSLHPDIIKVDIRIMQQSLNNNSFRQVLDAISEMSQKLGSTLLFEGVETEEEVNLALSMGANLLQGFYFSKANPDFLNKTVFSSKLQEILEKFSGIRFLELLSKCEKDQIIIDTLNRVFDGIQWDKTQDVAKQFLSILPLFPKNMRKVFLCDLNGYQMTPSYIRNENGDLVPKMNDMDNNYAWKPYFIKHKAESHHYKKPWSVTTPLYDMNAQSQYVIFTFSISPNLILISQIDWQ